METENEIWIKSCLSSDGCAMKVDGHLTVEKLHYLLNYVNCTPSVVSLEIRDPDHFGDYEADHVAVFLKNNNSLHHLNLSGNSITSTGASRIAEALEVNTGLTKLDLSNNSIADMGALAIACALKKNRSLMHLHIDCNKMSDNGVQAFADMISINVSNLYEFKITEVGERKWQSYIPKGGL